MICSHIYNVSGMIFSLFRLFCFPIDNRKSFLCLRNAVKKCMCLLKLLNSISKSLVDTTTRFLPTIIMIISSVVYVVGVHRHFNGAGAVESRSS